MFVFDVCVFLRNFVKMKYKDCCRTCLDQTKDLRHINAAVTIAGTEVRLSDILKNFYDYEFSSQDPSFPENICINCVHQLTITYSFKHLIESSISTLTKAANQVELHDDVNDTNFDCNYESDDDKPIVSLKFTKRDFKPMHKQKEEVKSLFCVECKGEFESSVLLSEHCRNIHPVKCSEGRDCDYCDEKFEDYRSLVLHKKLHLRPFLCEQCWEGFFTDDQLKCHTCHLGLIKEKKTPERRQCDQCGKSYPQGYIRIHMLTHSNERLYSCKYCPKKFKVPGGLHSHIQWNHKRVRNHICEICHASFISSSARSTHIRKNHLKEKKYHCDSCGKRFFSKSELQRHMLTHTGVKNFHCNLCDKSYQTRYGLNCHLKSHYS